MGTDRPSSVLRDTGQAARARLSLLVSGVSLLVVGMLLGLLAVTEGPGRTGELDLDVTLAQHRDTLETGVAQVIHVGLGPAVAPVVLLAICLLVWRHRRSSALLVAVLTIVGWFSVVVGKWAYRRQRPPADVVHALVHETGADSFPSGHTAFAAALVCSLLVVLVHEGRRIRLASAAGGLVVAIVAISRLVVGAHYYLDVLAAPLFAVGSIVVLCAVGGPCWRRVEQHVDGSRPPSLPSSDACCARQPPTPKPRP